MTVKVTKGQIYSGIYQKFYVIRSTICVESFILVSKSAYKAPTLALCHSTMNKIVQYFCCKHTKT